MVGMKDNQFGFRYREIKSDLSIEKQRVRVHTLTHNAIFFQIDGELLISYDSHPDVRVKAGDFYFLPRGAEVSACILSDNMKYIVARLEHNLDNKQTFSELLKEENRSQGTQYVFSPLPIREPLDLFVSSLREYILRGLYSPRLQNIKFLELYLLFQHCYTKAELANLFHPILTTNSKFKTFILDNYQVSVSIDELAQMANMSRSTFDRTFKDNFGMTPHKWMDIQTSILIQRKASEPNVSVKDIMYEVGVYNPSQFTQLCKRLCGVAPSKLIHH